MSDVKLFRTNGHVVDELTAGGFQLDKSLQTLIEQHLDTFLGVRRLDTECSTGTKYSGRTLDAIAAPTTCHITKSRI